MIERREYDPNKVAVFHKTKEKYGELSNMASGFPIDFNGILRIPSSEALYQMMRYTEYPNIQYEIANTNSGMAAKMKSKRYRHLSRGDWKKKRVIIMRWCLHMKYVSNRSTFHAALKSTEDLEIVERSRKDDFWGAIEMDGRLIGANILGRLLFELRSSVYAKKEPKIYIPDVPHLKIFGVDIETVFQHRSDGKVTDKLTMEPLFSEGRIR